MMSFRRKGELTHDCCPARGSCKRVEGTPHIFIIEGDYPEGALGNAMCLR